MAVVTDLNYALENRLIKKLDAMIDRCTKVKPARDAWLINEGSEGEGKCVQKGAKILMANGSWKNVEDVKEGDLIISPQHDGSHIFSKVTDTTSWFCNETYDVIQLNKVKKKLYTCSHNHPIPINILINPREKLTEEEKKFNRLERFEIFKNKKRLKGNWQIKNYEASHLFNLSKSTKKDITSLSSFKIDKFLEKDNCIIEPYCLGVYLGDGSFSSLKKGRAKLKGISIAHSNEKVMKEVLKFYEGKKVNTTRRNGDIYSFSTIGELSKQLTQYGLEGKGSGEKFIPKDALTSNSEYRIRLLAGLIDTDGYYYHGGYQFTLKSKRLIEDIKDLVYSLGGRCGEIREVKKGINSTGFVGTYYSITLYLNELKLPLKKEYKLKKNHSFYLSSNRISIDVVKSKPCMVYGFSLDSPSKWFVTDNWMITHNTNSSIAEAYYIKSKTGRDIHLFFRLEQLLDFAKRNEKKIIIWDEPALDSLKGDAITTINKDLLRLIMTCRKKQHFLITNMVKFYRFSEALVVDRALGIVHMFSRKNKIPGRFLYIRKKKLEYLYRDWTSKHLRSYSKYKSFGGCFPEIMDEHLDKMDIYINNIPHATLDIYNEEKDKSIEQIGEKKVVSKKELQYIQRLRRLQWGFVQVYKSKVLTLDKLGELVQVNPRIIQHWAQINKENDGSYSFEGDEDL